MRRKPAALADAPRTPTAAFLGAQTVVLERLDPSLVRALSANGRSQSHWPKTNARNRVMAGFYGAARAQGLKPPAWPVAVRFRWIVPTRGRRDLDNLASNGIQKAVLDSLVKGGWLPDDSSEHITAVLTEMEYQKGRRALVIEIESVQP